MTGRRIMTPDEVRRAVIRISHEIVEKQAGTTRLALVGIQRRGVPLARRLAAEIEANEGAALPVGALDIEFYRDDARLGHAPNVKGTDIGFDIDDVTVVLVDDVLYTGRTIRAAMDALREFGRPRAVRLAVLVDRGHRELPIRADHVGKNVPTSREEVVRVRVLEVDGEDAVDIEQAAVPAGAAGVILEKAAVARPDEEPGTTAVEPEPAWPHRHLLDTDVLTWPQIELVLDTARHMAGILAGERPRSVALKGVGVTNLFYEASTRTRVSFEVAAKHLSADVVNVAVSGSSIEKGESLLDTMRTLEALGARILVMRHGTSGAPYLVAREFRGAVVNAGDGLHGHPTQALLDLYTLLGHLPGGSLRGRKVVILGDVLHSRVARSNLWTLTAAGADVWLCGPSTLLRGFEAWASSGVGGDRRFTVTTDIDAALANADAVMTLRIQKERMASGLLPSLGEYAARFGLTRQRLALAAPGCLVMHPGPMNEGVEIAADVAAGPASVVTEQVANGVAVRMAVLALVASAAGISGVGVIAAGEPGGGAA